jgi:hypothetical protein
MRGEDADSIKTPTMASRYCHVNHCANASPKTYPSSYHLHDVPRLACDMNHLLKFDWPGQLPILALYKP